MVAMHVLIAGATGYIGGRLAPLLLERGHTVRVLVRDADRVRGRAWADRVDVVEGDLLDGDALAQALDGIDAAYYLVHAMGSGHDFARQDRATATHFAAYAQHVKHVVYLGGLLPEGERVISAHLRSRAEVGAILRGALPVTEFRAGPVIGSGSASFEMVRYLTERLPVMVAPKWINNVVSPIAVRDMLDYLVAAIETEPMGVVPVGGEAITFKRMMQVYAELRGLRRWIVPVPVLAPKLAARWIGAVTPISNRLAVPLVEGVIQPLVADTRYASERFSIVPMDYRQAVSRALDRVRDGAVETRWSDALGAHTATELADREGLIREVRSVVVSAPAERTFQMVACLGGERGWLTWGWAWRLRGALDKLIGGPGLRRGRRHPSRLLPGDALDFWRVERVEEPALLRLRAEMKLPGSAWLQYEVQPLGAWRCKLVQTALFAPRGLPGLAYWWGLYPMHRVIFTGLVNALKRQAER